MATRIMKGDYKKWLEKASPEDMVEAILKRELANLLCKTELDNKTIIAFERLSEISRKISQSQREEIKFYKQLGISGQEVQSKKLKEIEKAMDESELDDIDLQLRAALGDPDED